MPEIIEIGKVISRGQICIPNNIRRLRRIVILNSTITSMTLTPGILVAAYAGFSRTASVATGVILVSALLTCAVWVVAIHLFRHPLAADPALRKFINGTLRISK